MSVWDQIVSPGPVVTPVPSPTLVVGPVRPYGPTITGVRLPFSCTSAIASTWLEAARMFHADDEMLVSVRRTTEQPMRVWATRVQFGDYVNEMYGFVHAGVAWDDLVSLGALLAVSPTGNGSGRPRTPEMVATRAMLAIDSGLWTVDREMPTRSAIGWVLHCWHAGLPDKVQEITDTVQAWHGHGMVEDGYRFAAAGFTPDEAARARQDGTVDANELRLMAALRGAVLPAGE